MRACVSVQARLGPCTPSGMKFILNERCAIFIRQRLNNHMAPHLNCALAASLDDVVEQVGELVADEQRQRRASDLHAEQRERQAILVKVRVGVRVRVRVRVRLRVRFGLGLG